MKRFAAMVAVVALCASGAGAMADGGAKVRVSPKRGGPGKTFVVAFTAPSPSGDQGAISRSYAVRATRRAGAAPGCDSSAIVEATAAQANERVRVALVPATRWCRGRFRGVVTMTEGPNCSAGPPCSARAAATRPCPLSDAAGDPCGCCPQPGAGTKPACPERPMSDCCGIDDCQPPPPAMPSRVVTLGRFHFRVR